MVCAREGVATPLVKCAGMIACKCHLCVISAYHSKCLTLVLIFEMALSRAYRCHLATLWGCFCYKHSTLTVPALMMLCLLKQAMPLAYEHFI